MRLRWGQATRPGEAVLLHLALEEYDMPGLKTKNSIATGGRSRDRVVQRQRRETSSP